MNNLFGRRAVVIGVGIGGLSVAAAALPSRLPHPDVVSPLSSLDT